MEELLSCGMKKFFWIVSGILIEFYIVSCGIIWASNSGTSLLVTGLHTRLIKGISESS